MANKRDKDSVKKRCPPAMNPEARENQMIAGFNQGKDRKGNIGEAKRVNSGKDRSVAIYKTYRRAIH